MYTEEDMTLFWKAYQEMFYSEDEDYPEYNESEDEYIREFNNMEFYNS